MKAILRTLLVSVSLENWLSGLLAITTWSTTSGHTALQFLALLFITTPNKDQGKGINKRQATRQYPGLFGKAKKVYAILPLPTNKREIYTGNSKFLLE